LYAVPILGDLVQQNTEWRRLGILPIEVKSDVDRLSAQKQSGIEPEKSKFKGIIIGVGALGGAVSDIWTKEAWGDWIFVDHDVIKSHNTIRHIARNSHVGQYKAEIVKYMVNDNFHPGHYNSSAIIDKATNWDNQQLKSAIDSSDLIVDISTTLDVPRELSLVNDIGRSCSLFVTPSGTGRVLIFEDQTRKTRLDSLEAQYYKAIINNEWGKDHLIGNSGNLWVGAGCRDVSAVIPYETIQLNAAILARQLRLHKEKPESLIRVWALNDHSGSLFCETISSESAIYTEESGWRIIWDNEIKKKLRAIRFESLPSETGGIILGYVDHKIRSIFIVDILPAPYDSDSNTTGFTRGVSGLREALENVSVRTANIVGYIGEWHSHPAFSSAEPSTLDWELIRTISKIMANDGEPALMLIVGSAGDITLTVKEH
ncbi:MAG: ThiF family adenylyltransferase, partial [Candidatus Heimdallarchaeota archaeon]